MTKVKLCGLSRECDIEYANEALPEFIGFVFYPKSKRYVTPEKAAELKAILDYRIAAVGVFVDEDPAEIAKLVRSETIDIVQLHGNEDNHYIHKLRDYIEVPIIQAFLVKSDEDIRRAYLSDADFVMLDSLGGSGKTFDHSLIHDIPRPYFLSGGMSPENVKEAIEALHPYAIDASSSLETDGFKDKEKMIRFTDSIRD